MHVRNVTNKHWTCLSLQRFHPRIRLQKCYKTHAFIIENYVIFVIFQTAYKNIKFYLGISNSRIFARNIYNLAFARDIVPRYFGFIISTLTVAFVFNKTK